MLLLLEFHLIERVNLGKGVFTGKARGDLR